MRLIGRGEGEGKIGAWRKTAADLPIHNAIKTYFKAYVTSDGVRHIIESRQFTDLATNPMFSTCDLRAVPKKYRILVPEYIKDYVSPSHFAA